MAAYSRAAFQALLGANVIEARFTRRHDKPGWSGVRGAYVTTNWELLNGDLGLKTLNFKKPNGRGMGYDPKQYNLVVGWDLFRQEFRCFGVENSEIRNFYSVENDVDRAEFWQFFRDYIMQLSPNEKLIYMGYVGS